MTQLPDLKTVAIPYAAHNRCDVSSRKIQLAYDLEDSLLDFSASTSAE